MQRPLIKSLSVKTVNIPLKRPIVSKLGTFENWPYILIEITCSDGTVGKSYIGPYLVGYTTAIAVTMKELFKNYENREISPYTFFNEGMNSLSLLGRSGIALGDVKSYNSSGLWLNDPNTLYDEALELMSDGNFDAVKTG